MARAGNELITDWILPAEAWRLLVERWGDPDVCEKMARKALAEGMPWQCRMVQDGVKDPDLFRSDRRFQIFWREGWAQVIGPKPALCGPRHWFALSLAWVLALPGKPSEHEDDEPGRTFLKEWLVKNVPEHPHYPGEEMMPYARRLKAIMLKDPKASDKLRRATPKSIATRLYDLGLGPRKFQSARRRSQA